MKKLLLVLFLVLCIGVAARFLYRSVVEEIDWRTDRAVQLSVLRQAEKRRRLAEMFRNYLRERETDVFAGGGKAWETDGSMEWTRIK